MKTMVSLLMAVLLSASAAWAGDIGFNLDLHVNSPSLAPIIVSEPPLFLTPPELGFQVAVGVACDMFRIDGRFFQCREGHWFVSSQYDGPWQGVDSRQLPRGLAQKRYADMLRLRDAEYAKYRKNGKGYKGKAYRPEKSNRGRGQGNGKGKGKKNKNK